MGGLVFIFILIAQNILKFGVKNRYLHAFKQQLHKHDT